MPGRYFEDLQAGMVIRHSLSRTVTEMDNVLFSSLTMNTQPLHIDEHFARGTRFGARIVNGLFTLGLATGMTVPELTEGTIVANLGYDKVRHVAPVFHGDTLRVETLVIDKRESRSNPDAGIVSFRHTARNQDGAVVLEFERTALFLKRPAQDGAAPPGEPRDWQGYYRAHERRGPWPLLLNVLDRFDREPEAQRLAVDLGFGNGHETLALLERGWRVFAVDGEAEAVRRLEAMVPADQRARLEIHHAMFHEVALPPADLVWAGLSLPFCGPSHFEVVWDKIVAATKPGGRFAGQFFGPHDAWSAKADMTILDEDHIRALLARFDVEFEKEIEADRPQANGPTKHWHVFSLIARRSR